MTHRGTRGAAPNWLLFVVVFGVVAGLGILLLVAGFALRGWLPARPPTATLQPETVPTAWLTPAEGAPGAELRANGSGWAPDEVILIALRDGGQDETALATAIAADDGTWQTSFTVPGIEHWDSLPATASLRIWSPASGSEVLVMLQVIAPSETPEPGLTPTGTSPAPSPTPSPCTDQAAFLADVTIPDNTPLAPGESFVKTWQLRNAGTCPWTTDYALVFAGDNQMGGPPVMDLPTIVEPGDTIELSVNLIAPTAPGTYRGRWQLRNAGGGIFGIGDSANRPFWVRIIVGSTPTPTSAATDWRGEYFANRNLTGNPSLTRTDAAIDFDWSTQSPATSLPADSFSVRWNGTFSFQQAAYRFYARSDDGVRVWLDDVLIIDQWHDASTITHAAERTMSAGSHRLRVEYYENQGDARIRVWWERTDEFPQWRGEYFGRIDLSGTPAFVRNDAAIDFDWGRDAPAPSLPTNDFSVRWTRMVLLEAGTYRFQAVMDDGMRVYLDDVLLIDRWRDGSDHKEIERALSAGYHMLQVEYYEHTGEAVARLNWERVTSYADWKGEYWPNQTLQGAPAVMRNDAAVDMNWGSGSPAPDLPADGFSARWTRTLTFNSGLYRLHAMADDGVRVYVDGARVIDEWHDSSGSTVYMVEVPLDGQHEIKVEYYEGSGQALIKLWWQRLGSLPTATPTVTPILPTATPTAIPPTDTPAPNNPPVAVDDVSATDVDVAVSVNVLENDSDPDGDSLTVSAFDALSTQGGAVDCTGAGLCTYIPPASFTGADAFTYTISDGRGGSATATVTITVNPLPETHQDSLIAHCSLF